MGYQMRHPLKSLGVSDCLGWFLLQEQRDWARVFVHQVLLNLLFKICMDSHFLWFPGGVPGHHF